MDNGSRMDVLHACACVLKARPKAIFEAYLAGFDTKSIARVRS